MIGRLMDFLRIKYFAGYFMITSVIFGVAWVDEERMLQIYFGIVGFDIAFYGEDE